ncbi:hypothetical protein JRQ81_019492, partial [Phrynocephalus forsythii]
SDWANDVTDRKSLSGFAIRFDTLIGWKSRKQTFVATSTAEAEFATISEICSEVVWYKQILIDLKIKVEQAVTVFEDSTTCIQMATTDRMKCRSKHIDIKYHNGREAVKDKLIQLVYCETEKNLADNFIKPLSAQRHKELTENLGICSVQQ